MTQADESNASYGPLKGPDLRYDRAMKRVSIQDLKSRLSSVIAEAESGVTVVITRHNEPVAQLTPARTSHVTRGARVGSGRLQPALTRGSGGRYLDVLGADRAGR
jgi:prevent-host-death family protein